MRTTAKEPIGVYPAKVPWVKMEMNAQFLAQQNVVQRICNALVEKIGTNVKCRNSASQTKVSVSWVKMEMNAQFLAQQNVVQTTCNALVEKMETNVKCQKPAFQAKVH